MNNSAINKPKLEIPPEVHLIGCGGVGSWVLPALVRIVPDDIHLWDGDILEDQNLDRQLFPEGAIGKNKAAALTEIFNDHISAAHEEYFYEGSSVFDGSLILCCADNHAARRASLYKADETNSTTIISGNEYTDADAYIYVPHLMRGTPNDPRVFAPEILTDNSGDPRRPDGCTGLAAVERPQLVLANMAAATHMLRLMWWWFAEARGLKRETRDFWPVMHRTSASRSFTVLYKDRLAERKQVA